MKKVTCSCGATLDVGALSPGARVRCPKCKKPVAVPAADDHAHPQRTGAAHGRPERAGRPNRALLFGSAAGLVLLVGAFLLSQGGKKPEPAPAPETGKYDAIVKEINPQDGRGWYAVALACRDNGLRDKFEENLEKACAMAPSDAQIAGAFQGLVEGWLAKIPTTKEKANEIFKLGERAEKAGLTKFAERIYLSIVGEPPNRPGIDRFHPGANTKLGLVLTPYGTYEDKELYEDTKAKLEDMAKRDEFIKTLPPWQQKAYYEKERIEKDTGLKFKTFATPPYLVAVQDSPGWAAELIANDYREVVDTLYARFRREYAEKFGISEVFEGEKADRVLPIIVFDSKETYQKQNPDLPDWAGGHFSRMTGDIQMFKVQDAYETVFHEGTHQLVAAATKVLGDKDTNTHWLTEGIACYFEAFKRDANFQIQLGAVSDVYLARVQQFARKGMQLPFDMFVGRDYVTFMVQQEAIRDPVKRELFVDISYAQSWAFVYFLRNAANGKYREKFDTYFKEELKGQGGMEAFKRIFGDVKAIEAEWLAYVKDLKPGN